MARGRTGEDRFLGWRRSDRTVTAGPNLLMESCRRCGVKPRHADRRRFVAMSPRDGVNQEVAHGTQASVVAA